MFLTWLYNSSSIEFTVVDVITVNLFIFFFLLTVIPIVLYASLKRSKRKLNLLPPGPFSIPILSDLQWLPKSFPDLEPILRSFRSKYGPIFTLYIVGRKVIFITSHDLAHQALVGNGPAFADRPPLPETIKFISSNQHNISTAPYGSLWRLLRRNLTSQIIHPSKIKSYSPCRKWVMDALINKLKADQSDEWGTNKRAICVADHFEYAILNLLVFMCFGQKLDEKSIKEIEVVQRALLFSSNNRHNILNFVPPILGKILFQNRWRELHELRGNRRNVLVPLIRARLAAKQKFLEQQQEQEEKENLFVDVAYVDTLLDLTLPDELGGRKLKEHETVTLCSEFLTGGTDTTSTALQWIMANLVKYPEIQSKLFDEIKGVRKSNEDEINEEDIEMMPYLKAVVLEGLRRHPPTHFLLPHAVTQDQQLEGYVIPKDAVVTFMVADIGWDPKLWKDPMEFRPERFLSGEGEGFDITGNREIKMMPFGAGRRICPGLALALLHLEYFVANLVREFEWTARIGDDVDLSEKQEFTMMMKNPLWAHISPRTS